MEHTRRIVKGLIRVEITDNPSEYTELTLKNALKHIVKTMQIDSKGMRINFKIVTDDTE